MISVPVTSDTINNTIGHLPRIPSEARLIEVGLKRKQEYGRAHRKELIDANKVLKVLDHLREAGNPYYQEFDNLSSYESRCKQFDENGHKMLFGEEEENLSAPADERSCEEDNVDHDSQADKGDEETEDVKDTIRKHQFNHNRNTCMTNNYPEMFTNENGANGKDT